MDNGEDLLKLLKQEYVLDNNKDIKTLREILQSTGKSHLETKVDKNLAIGQYLCKPW